MCDIITRIIQSLEMDFGFEGCIQYMKFNNKEFNITFPSEDIINGENIQECPDNLCFYNKCSGNGRCRLVNEFNQTESECVCNKEFFGNRCESTRNACLNLPCQGTNSSCVTTSTGSFQCICSDTTDGLFCQNSI